MRVFDGSPPGLSLAEVARRTGLDRAAARRLVLTLVECGYLVKNGRDFVQTAKVLGLAGGYLQARGIGARVQPVLDRHAARLGAAITYAVREGDRALLVAQSTLQDSPVSFGFTMGSGLPMLHTALGRMLLAGLEPETASDLVHQAPCPAHTPKSEVRRDVIAQTVARIRSQGFAVVDSEFEAGIIGFSAPVGCTAVVGASAARGIAATDAMADRYIGALQACAAELVAVQ
ncbi:IclR family transcriptional regulator [Thalassococcus sp. S3]|nr:IclR family transcriptional regulator [Thalassococcus sp. S3]